MASKKPSGLGRGLGALLGDDVMKTESSGSLSLPTGGDLLITAPEAL